ncbi:MAG TPA: hypothetical protein VI958_08495, partial [Acidobacteriota bacterium]
TEIEDLQEELQSILNKMDDIEDPSDLDTLRFDANRVNKELRREQSRLESARGNMEEAEQELRSKARLFVWIDRPRTTILDHAMLGLFILAFLAGSAAQLKRKDKLLLIL